MPRAQQLPDVQPCTSPPHNTTAPFRLHRFQPASATKAGARQATHLQPLPPIHAPHEDRQVAVQHEVQVAHLVRVRGPSMHLVMLQYRRAVQATLGEEKNGGWAVAQAQPTHHA